MATLILRRPAKLGGVQYPAGKHAVPDEYCTGWLYDALVEDGDIVVAGSEAPAVDSLKKQVEALRTRIAELERERRAIGRPKKEQVGASE